MKIPMKKTWATAVGLALAVSAAGGVAVAAGAGDWYSGGNATVADHDRTTVPLRLYNAAGVQVTSGSTTTPVAAFAAADGAVRTGDAYASLFVHLPQADTAPGAWPGVQVTGTDKFAGAGAVTAPASLTGKPYVTTTADGYTLADVAAALPNTETSASFAGVYELRLRTSSKADGVSNEYAAAYLKVSGTSWTVTSAPILGDDETDPTPVATSVAVAWPARITYGTATTVGVTVTPASGAAKPSGQVRLVSGATTLGTATLSAAGTASLPVSRTALLPGNRSLQVVYSGVTGAFNPSQSTARTIAVAKAVPGRPTVKVTKAPTAKKAGAAAVAVPTTSGLTKAGGTAQLVLKKGKTVKKIKVTVKAGAAKVKLPKLTAGTWTATLVYQGDVRYTDATSKAVKVKVKKK